ncbi:hypothetical protein P692DRAFT_20878919 [Suillus brevipes Sb2]|nr:hypothetical protein P692DRAFT_20878919 [Suillus brevipes Sb2]
MTIGIQWLVDRHPKAGGSKSMQVDRHPEPARAQSDTPAIKRAKLDNPSHGNVKEKCRYSLSLLKFSERRNFLGRLIFFSDTAFLEKASPHTLEAYQKILWQVESRYGPVLEAFEVEGTRERCLVIRYKMGDTSRFFSALSNLYHLYQLYSARKYVERFSNGITIISLYLNPMPNYWRPDDSFSHGGRWIDIHASGSASGGQWIDIRRQADRHPLDVPT